MNMVSVGLILGAMLVLVAWWTVRVYTAWRFKHRKIAALEGVIAALSARLEEVTRELIAARGQISQQFEQVKEAARLTEEFKTISLFIAKSYPHEIARGDHTFFKTTADMVVHYLRKERNTSGWGQPQQQTESTPLK